jgi:branched-chain amino acid transport system permease protein
MDHSIASLLAPLGIKLASDSALSSITIAQTAPVLPYLLMVLMLIVRPKGLMGTRET